MNKKNYNFEDILCHYNLEGDIINIQPAGSGHINDTFRAENGDKTKPDYILQRINHTIFKDVPLLMRNIEHVTNHIRKKMIAQGVTDSRKQGLTVIPAKDQKLFYQDASGNYWRVFNYINDANSYDLVETREQAYQGGRAFGEFQRLLADLDPTLLGEIIPNFHNIQTRYAKLKSVIHADVPGRVKEVLPEIAFVAERIEDMSMILRNGEAGKLPLRITHNDAKFNNVLLDKNDQPLCVVDLDTAMPGYVAYDFGDSIRTSVNTAVEDEKDLSKINVRMDLFEGYTSGFLKETGKSLTEDEIASLPMGSLLLPYIMGVRFLTDYIEGDVYYKIHFPEHNLQRARAQFQLVRKLEENYDRIKEIVYKCADNHRG